MKKRIIGVLLALVMVLSVLPVSGVFALEAETDGSKQQYEENQKVFESALVVEAKEAKEAEELDVDEVYPPTEWLKAEKAEDLGYLAYAEGYTDAKEDAAFGLYTKLDSIFECIAVYEKDDEDRHSYEATLEHDKTIRLKGNKHYYYFQEVVEDAYTTLADGQLTEKKIALLQPGWYVDDEGTLILINFESELHIVAFGDLNIYLAGVNFIGKDAKEIEPDLDAVDEGVVPAGIDVQNGTLKFSGSGQLYVVGAETGIKAKQLLVELGSEYCTIYASGRSEAVTSQNDITSSDYKLVVKGSKEYKRQIDDFTKEAAWLTIDKELKEDNYYTYWVIAGPEGEEEPAYYAESVVIKPLVCTVNYYDALDAEEVYATEEVIAGHTVEALPEAPTADGAKFVGWYTVSFDEEGNAILEDFDETTPVTEEVTSVYAEWETNPATGISGSNTTLMIAGGLLVLAVAAVVVLRKRSTQR